MSELPPINNTTSNVLHTGGKTLITGGNIQFYKNDTYHLVENSRLQEMQEFVGNGMQSLINRTLPTISEEA